MSLAEMTKVSFNRYPWVLLAAFALAAAARGQTAEVTAICYRCQQSRPLA